MIDGQPGWGDGVSIMGTPITNQVTMFSANGKDIENSLIGIWGTTVGVPNLELDGKITVPGAIIRGNQPDRAGYRGLFNGNPPFIGWNTGHTGR